MPKPRYEAISFILDADYTVMLRAVMQADGWRGSASEYAARVLCWSLASDVADLGDLDLSKPSNQGLPQVQVPRRVLQRAKRDSKT